MSGGIFQYSVYIGLNQIKIQIPNEVVTNWKTENPIAASTSSWCLQWKHDGIHNKNIVSNIIINKTSCCSFNVYVLL